MLIKEYWRYNNRLVRQNHAICRDVIFLKEAPIMDEFSRVKRLPPYVFSIVDGFKATAKEQGIDIIDFSMGNPDQATPAHIVDKLVAAASEGVNHRYSASRGLPMLRNAITHWYAKRFNVELDADTETIVTLGSKEGLAHLALAMTDQGDTIIAPNPCYPIHCFGFIIAGADICHIPLHPEEFTPQAFCDKLITAIEQNWPRPKAIVLNFPSNPSAICVDLDFFSEIIAIAKRYDVYIIHDFAYADLCFDDYQAPSILQVPGAKDIAVESYSLSKSYNMPGWRVGFICGNKNLVAALTRLKSYVDYGLFAPIEHAAVAALEGPQDCIDEIRDLYCSRRNLLCDGLNNAGWEVEKPKATMFVWAKIPEQFRKMGSLEFCKFMIEEAQVAVSPGIGFGEHGDEYVRFALIENQQRTITALTGIRKILQTSDNKERVA